MKNLIELEDFYYNEQGLIVFTAGYHVSRGYCCGNGCTHCPFKYNPVREPTQTEYLSLISHGKENN